MKIRFNRTGSERKTLVTAIGEVLETKPVYRGAPSFIYDIKGFEVDKEGTLTIDDSVDGNVVKKLLVELETRGFAFEKPQNETQDSRDACETLVIEMSREGFTDIAITNLENLIESKGALIKKAIGVEELPIEQTEDTLRFPWFEFDTDGDKVKAYTYFISGICDMAKEHKRINAKAKEVDNEKYAFRCFLLRLGFIGAEFKTVRKILLSKLTGSSAFKNGASTHEEVEQ